MITWQILNLMIISTEDLELKLNHEWNFSIYQTWMRPNTWNSSDIDNGKVRVTNFSFFKFKIFNFWIRVDNLGLFTIRGGVGIN